MTVNAVQIASYLCKKSAVIFIGQSHYESLFLGEALRCFCTEMFNSALNCGKESLCVRQPASGEDEGSDLK